MAGVSGEQSDLVELGMLVELTTEERTANGSIMYRLALTAL